MLDFLQRTRAPLPRRVDADARGVPVVDGDDPAAREVLRRIVDEAVLLQGLAEDILEGVRQRRPAAQLARPCGALISRFVALRAAVPDPVDARLRPAAWALREALDHHALMLSWSLALLADLGPERVQRQLDSLDGLGPPAQRMYALQQELAAPTPARAA